MNIDPFYGNSKNRIELRYSDIVLIRAEALIELRREQEALPLINSIRERAKKSTLFIPYAKNLSIDTYQNGINCTWNYEFAQKALQWERR